MFTSASQPPATVSTGTSNAIAVDALSVEFTPQAEPPIRRRGRAKGPKNQTPVSVPHKIRLLGVCGAKERAKPDRLRNELVSVEWRGMGKGGVGEGRDGKGGRGRRDEKGGRIWVVL